MSEKGKEASPSNDNGGFKTFLYNSATGECLGRTGSSWLKILIFYLIFYILLAAFWGLLLFIFYQTLDPHRPKWQLDASRIGSNPGLGFRPRPPEDKIESTLIWFSSGATGNHKPYVENLESFLKEYTQDSGPSGKGDAVASADDCRAGKPPASGKYCPFNYKDQGLGTGPCNANNKFGYELGNPCILIKINKIFGWVPEPLTDKPANMPSFNGTMDGIIITCEGENPADKENIGPIEYTPSQTIRSNFFPFENQHGYLSPFVMVRFANPARGILINVECKAWARNIRHDRSEREGSVHFELLID